MDRCTGHRDYETTLASFASFFPAVRSNVLTSEPGCNISRWLPLLSVRRSCSPEDSCLHVLCELVLGYSTHSRLSEIVIYSDSLI